MKALTAIKRYFEQEPHGRKVPMDELKSLSNEDRQELGAFAAKELGVELDD